MLVNNFYVLIINLKHFGKCICCLYSLWQTIVTPDITSMSPTWVGLKMITALEEVSIFLEDQRFHTSTPDLVSILFVLPWDSGVSMRPGFLSVEPCGSGMLTFMVLTVCRVETSQLFCIVAEIVALLWQHMLTLIGRSEEGKMCTRVTPQCDELLYCPCLLPVVCFSSVPPAYYVFLF